MIEELTPYPLGAFAEIALNYSFHDAVFYATWDTLPRRGAAGATVLIYPLLYSRLYCEGSSRPTAPPLWWIAGFVTKIGYFLTRNLFVSHKRTCGSTIFPKRISPPKICTELTFDRFTSDFDHSLDRPR
jgi:hypothetical protein